MRTKNTEIDVLESLKKGDERAFRFIYDTYYIGLCNIAKGYLSDPHLSESIVGDVIYNLWENHDRIEIKTSLKQYLYRSVMNRCINYLQLEHIRKEVAFSNYDINILDNLWHVKEDSPIEKLMEKELNKEIQNSIEQLSEETRLVFCLSRIEDKKYEEIAEIRGISVNTVKYHIKKALIQLREILKPI